MWPENWPAVQFFARMGTQWRVGFGGPIGLDYNVVFRLLDEEGYSRQQWREMLDDIQVLEVEALKTLGGQNG